MDKVYAIHRSLSLNPRGVTKSRLIQVVAGSESTLFRTLRFMRSCLNAPIESNRKTGLFRYREGVTYELPGIWFSGEELSAFLELAARLEELQAEFLSGHVLKPLKDKLEGILKAKGISTAGMRDRLRFLPLRSRKVEGATFHLVIDALFKKRRIQIGYQDADSGSLSERIVSPLRVVRYRDNWYLDCFCHLRNDFRILSVDGIQTATLTSEAAVPVSQAQAEAYFTSAYGIFGGKADKVAEIAFSGAAARFVARECWHPREEREMLPDGRLLLKIPYRDARELVGDVLHWGEDAEILHPSELRSNLVEKLKGLERIYGPS